MNRNVTAGEEAAGRVTVAKAYRKEVVRAGLTVVGHIAGEANFLFANLPAAGEMRHVSIKGERRNFG
jgi:hypothetical protein